jgi:hypothetical protein
VSARVFNLWNFAAYQVAWFAVVIGAAQGFAWAGAAVALLVAGAHLTLRRDAGEVKLMAVAAGIGLLVDGTLAITGQVRFAAPWPPNLAPFWMLCLWIAFATTLNHSLRWLMGRPVAAAVAGAVGGPLAYLAAAKLGALTIVAAPMTLPLIALLWTPAMVALSMFVMRGSLQASEGRMAA